MEWVIDSSIALAWALPDEQSATANRFITELHRDDQLWIPALWWYEISNGLTVCQRRGRLSDSALPEALRLIGDLLLSTDTMLGCEGIARFSSVARERCLTAYDAAYLELAGRRGIGLATLDHALAAAAAAAGVEVFS